MTLSLTILLEKATRLLLRELHAQHSRASSNIPNTKPFVPESRRVGLMALLNFLAATADTHEDERTRQSITTTAAIPGEYGPRTTPPPRVESPSLSHLAHRSIPLQTHLASCDGEEHRSSPTVASSLEVVQRESRLHDILPRQWRTVHMKEAHEQEILEFATHTKPSRAKPRQNSSALLPAHGEQ